MTLAGILFFGLIGVVLVALIARVITAHTRATQNDDTVDRGSGSGV